MGWVSLLPWGRSRVALPTSRTMGWETRRRKPRNSTFLLAQKTRALSATKELGKLCSRSSIRAGRDGCLPCLSQSFIIFFTIIIPRPKQDVWNKRTHSQEMIRCCTKKPHRFLYNPSCLPTPRVQPLTAMMVPHLHLRFNYFKKRIKDTLWLNHFGGLPTKTLSDSGLSAEISTA